jgi:protein ImuB
MLWVAQLFPSPGNTPPPDDQLHGLFMWALQYTPRIAVVEEAVVLKNFIAQRLEELIL